MTLTWGKQAHQQGHHQTRVLFTLNNMLLMTLMTLFPYK